MPKNEVNHQPPSVREVFSLSCRLQEVMGRVSKGAMPIDLALKGVQALLDGDYRIISRKVEIFGRYLNHIDDQKDRWIELNRQVPENLRIDEKILLKLSSNSNHYQSVDSLETFGLKFRFPQHEILYVFALLRAAFPDCDISDSCCLFLSKDSVKRNNMVRRNHSSECWYNSMMQSSGQLGSGTNSYSQANGFDLEIMRIKLNLLSYWKCSAELRKNFLLLENDCFAGARALFACCLQNPKIFYQFDGKALPRILASDLFYDMEGDQKGHLRWYFDKTDNRLKVELSASVDVDAEYGMPSVIED